MNLTDFTAIIQQNENLTRAQMNDAARCLFQQIDDVEVVRQFLMSLHAKGETVEEIVGLVDIVQSMQTTPPSVQDTYFDNCGTGGDQLNTFNISTTTAFVLAGAGVKVAKHGNRKISSQAGSSDVLEALHINVNQSPKQLIDQLNNIGIAFLHAPNFHPKLGLLKDIRSSIPHATIFNLIGPLCNPLPLHAQIVGINRLDLLETYTHALQLLGRKRAIVVSGNCRLDEVSISGITHYALLQNEEITLHKAQPEQLGILSVSMEDIVGGTPEENAEILINVLKGQQSPYLQTVVLNAAFAFYANGSVDTLLAGKQLALQTIQSGAAYEKLRAVQQLHVKEGIA